jgi:taurine dioxygenase
MIDIVPTGKILGATVNGMDLSRALTDDAFDEILRALGRYGVLRFPHQALKPAAQKTFASRFGSLEVHVAGLYQDPEHPEIMFLSNIVEDGKPIGLADAGQDWHTDMSYNRVIALANVLHAIQVPLDELGHPLGSTHFADMHAAYDDLPAEMKARSRRSPIRCSSPIRSPDARCSMPTPATRRINDMDAEESDEILSFLFAHQLQPKYCYEQQWSEGDLIMWDNIGTLHNAIADYGPHQPRLMQRCQVMADWIFQHPVKGVA